MSRSVSWRRTCPDSVKRRIEQALDARFYILRETGPTGFLVKQDDDDKKYKVYLGDPNSCTCPAFIKERELCIHILWILLRKFRLAKENALLFQQALVEREINEIIHGIHIQRRSDVKTVSVQLEEKGQLPAKSVDVEDVCPICQEELLENKEPLTHCKYGCGNNIHIKCMKVWAQHRKSNGDNLVKCPLCRSDFGTYQDIIQEFHRLASRQRKKIETNDVHIGATCQSCRISPIQGKCFRCVVCLDYHLCHECFGKQVHVQHSFQFRKNTNQRWRPASRHPSKPLPDGIVENLQTRELSENDYDLLLNLDRNHNIDGAVNGRQVIIPLYVLRESSAEIKENLQCQICCEAFRISVGARRLACQHTFHQSCIDDWVSRGNSLCPFDGHRIAAREEVKPRKSDRETRSSITEGNSGSDLSILGINSLNGHATKLNQPTKWKPARRRSRNFSSTDSEGMGCDVNDLIISGFSGRSNSFDNTMQLAPSPQRKDFTSKRNITPPINSTSTQRPTITPSGLPPIHPSASQRIRSVNSANRRDTAAAHLSKGGRKENLDELKVGASSATSVNTDPSRQQRRSRSNPVKNRLSSGQLKSISASEPNLIDLTAAFRISAISKFDDSKSSDL